jgi:hypothetical protein
MDMEQAIDNDILQIEDLIRHRLHEFIDTRLLLMTKSQWLRVYNGKLEKRRELMELSFIRNMKPSRGAILDFFSKVESLIREMIQAKMLGLFSNQGYEFDDLLQRISLQECVDIMKKWNMIDSNLQRKIKTLAGVRNQFAHCWSEKEVSYKRDPSDNPISLIKNINQFKKDAEEVWIKLIEYYIKLEYKFIGRLKSRLEDRIITEKERFSKPRWCLLCGTKGKSYTNEELKFHLLDGHSHEDLAEMIGKQGWSI